MISSTLSDSKHGHKDCKQLKYGNVHLGFSVCCSSVQRFSICFNWNEIYFCLYNCDQRADVIVWYWLILKLYKETTLNVQLILKCWLSNRKDVMTLVTVLILFFTDYVMESLKISLLLLNLLRENCNSTTVKHRAVGRRGRVRCYAAEPILYLPKITYCS